MTSTKLKRLTDFFSSTLRKKLRNRAFLQDSIPTFVIPNDHITKKDVETLYAHENSNKRQGSIFRDFVTYCHSPIDIHQENIDDGPLHKDLLRATARVLNISTDVLKNIAKHEISITIARIKNSGKSWSISRMRKLVAPIAVRILYKIVFKDDCPSNAEHLFLENVYDFIDTVHSLKRKPNLKLRNLVLNFIEAKLQHGETIDRIFSESAQRLSTTEMAMHVQGVFFHTGITQVTEGVCHALIEISKNKLIEEKLLAEENDEQYKDNIILESLRLYPLFGFTNRITSSEIKINENIVVPPETQFLVDFQNYHQIGYENAHIFMPDRWKELNKKNQCFIPFGVGKRRCPAEKFSLCVTKEIVCDLAKSLLFYVPTKHHRKLEGGVLCGVFLRTQPTNYFLLRIIQFSVMIQDLMELSYRNFLILIIFPLMVRDAISIGNHRRH